MPRLRGREREDDEIHHGENDQSINDARRDRVISDKPEAEAGGEKESNQRERDEKMQGQTENGGGGPALKCLGAEQAAGDELQKPRDGRSPRKNDDDGREDIKRADDQAGHNNSSGG